jgi:hypothetical protein
MRKRLVIILAMFAFCAMTEPTGAQTNRRRPTTPAPAPTPSKSRVRGPQGKISSIILCRSKGGSDVIITLSDFKRFGRTFNCISGTFVADLTPCAPNGAYGLSAPTGSAGLTGVVDRWQDYRDHTGGVTSNYVNSHEIYFEAGFTGAGSGYAESWHFSVSRLTGVAHLELSDGSASSYSCTRAKPKF